MTHQADSNVIEEALQLLTQSGLEHMNDAMRIERSHALDAAPYERTAGRRGEHWRHWSDDEKIAQKNRGIAPGSIDTCVQVSLIPKEGLVPIGQATFQQEANPTREKPTLDLSVQHVRLGSPASPHARGRNASSRRAKANATPADCVAETRLWP
jgi:hypothetical protein